MTNVLPAGIDTPALVIDLPRLRANISAMAEAMASHAVALRPHFKTSKMTEVASMQLEAGAVGFTCATPAEVEVLLAAGVEDIFWAHAPATPAKARLAAEANRKARVAVGVDNPALASAVAQAARAAGTVVPVLIEVDTGLRRTGVVPEGASSLAAEVAMLPGVRIDGVYMHEGQLASIRGAREDLMGAGCRASNLLVQVADQLRADGHGIDVVSVGSTPGWDSAPFVAGVTEARPGTYVFYDANQLRLGSAKLSQCALTVLSTVVSLPREAEAVIDAGIKAMSSDRSNRGDTLGLIVSDDCASREDATFARAYEEHGIVEGRLAAGLSVGDTIRILPNHACGAVNMYGRVVIVEDDTVVDVWKPMARH